MKQSLHLRLVLAAIVLLIAFLGLAGIVLERAFRESSQQAINERLQVYIYTLIAVADLDQSGELRLPANLQESRFTIPGSGLQGFILNADGEQLWRSASAIGMSIHPPAPRTKNGESSFRLNGHRLELFHPISWELANGKALQLLFAVSEHIDALYKPVKQFRHTLWLWLGGIGILLLATQIWILRWSLSPLRTMTQQVEAIEAGGIEHLPDTYPIELQGLANNLNALLHSERSHKERYKNTLADLAHSLKTPLAILRGCREQQGIPPAVSQTLDNQVARMTDIVEYQLKHAAASTRSLIAPELNIAVLMDKITDALGKVYADKGVVIATRCARDGMFSCEEGDLYEIVGNLMDNACKWCESNVKVSVSFPKERHKKQSGFSLIVEDDGPGIPENQLQSVLQRGMRADESTAGHGIGLSIVKELVQLSAGSLDFSTSELGGLKVEVFLPAPL